MHHGRTGQNRENLHPDSSRANDSLQDFRPDLVAIEVHVGQFIIEFRYFRYQLLACILREFPEIIGDLRFGGFNGVRGPVNVRSHGHEVDGASELAFLADR